MNDLKWDDKLSEDVDVDEGLGQSYCFQYSKYHVQPPLTPCSSQSHSEYQPIMGEECFEARQWSPPSRQASPSRLKYLASCSRFWEKVKTSNNEAEKTSFPFVVLSYNILAQTLLENHPYLYTRCEPTALQWDNRFKRIIDEINSIKPDILCLQEVQKSHLQQITSYFEKQGFRGIFKQRTGSRTDGCAIYIRESVFEIIDYQSVEFFQPNVKLLSRDNIGLMMKLKAKSLPDSPFVVCTTHLLYNPKRNDVRLAQMQVFLAEIDRFSYQSSAHLPVIMTGDLNSKPCSPVSSLIADRCFNFVNFFTNLNNIAVTSDCQHLGVYLQRLKENPCQDLKSSMLHHSEIKESHECGSNNSKVTAECYKDLFESGCVRHNLNFKSVYNHVKATGEEEATTFQNQWVSVDYMYYSLGVTGYLDVLETLRLPTVAECKSMGAIPNSHFGSDHLCLAAKFILQGKTHNNS